MQINALGFLKDSYTGNMNISKSWKGTVNMVELAWNENDRSQGRKACREGNNSGKGTKECYEVTVHPQSHLIYLKKNLSQ